MRQRNGVTASVRVHDLTHRYPSSAGVLTVLEHLSFEVPAGAYAALTGPSGAGKTTLLSLLGGLDSVQQGQIDVGGTDVSLLRGDALAGYRRETVGFVFQHFGLMEMLTASENIELARALAGISPAQRRKEARELLASVGLGDRADHRPHALSGGERQRVAIARALANGPRLLLADEPTGNLDEESAALVMGVLESMPGQRGVTLMVVTHNGAIAARADVRLSLKAGRLSRAAS